MTKCRWNLSRPGDSQQDRSRGNRRIRRLLGRGILLLLCACADTRPFEQRYSVEQLIQMEEVLKVPSCAVEYIRCTQDRDGQTHCALTRTERQTAWSGQTETWSADCEPKYERFVTQMRRIERALQVLDPVPECYHIPEDLLRKVGMYHTGDVRRSFLKRGGVFFDFKNPECMLLMCAYQARHTPERRPGAPEVCADLQRKQQAAQKKD